MPRPLRVLFLTAYFPKPGNPLIGTWALAQARALARRADLSVRVVSPNAYIPRIVGHFKPGARAYSECPPSYDWDGLRVDYPHWLVYPVGHDTLGINYRYPAPFLRLGWQSARGELERIAREHRPDVVFAHHTGANGYLAMHLKRQFGVPYVITDHLFSEIAHCEEMPARRALFNRIIAGSSRMIAVARRMEDDTRRVFPFAKTITVHNGAQTPTPAQLRAPRPPELKGKRVVLGASILYASKGFAALVRAWSQIEARFPDAILRIVGDGDDRAHIEATIAELKLGERVQMVGALEHDDLMQEMVWADVFALISRDDPFPTVILEALAAAKPLVWPADSGVNDVLEDGKHGLKVPPHDVEATAKALAKILSDDALRAQMGRASSELSASRLTWDANAAAMSEIFHEVVGERRTPHLPANEFAGKSQLHQPNLMDKLPPADDIVEAPSLDQLREFANPHSLKNKLLRVLWGWVWLLLFRPSPRLLFAWRALLLRLFGARLARGARVYPNVKFWAPWNLTMESGATLADDVDCYCVAPITIERGAIVSQYSFLCSAAHDISDPAGALTTAPITIQAGAWIFADVFIGPGVTIGEGAVVGARSSVYRDVAPWIVVGGNPARFIKKRELKSAASTDGNS